MTKEQVKMFRDSYMKEVTHHSDPTRKNTLGEYIRIILDGGIEYTTTADFVIFDDENEMVHCICLNDEPNSQYDFPIKVMSSEYAIIWHIESIFTKDNFYTLLNEGFLSSMMNDAQKEFVKTWVKSTNNQAIAPIEATPYYTQNPTITHKKVSVIPRDDGIKRATSPASLASNSVKSVKTAESFIEAINNAEAGANIVLAGSIELTETIKLEKPINIVGGTVTSSAPKTFEFYADATIRNMTIKNSANNGRCIDTRKSVNVELDKVTIETTSTSNNQPISINGDENEGTVLTLKNSRVNAGAAGYPIMTTVKADITIENSTINGYCSVAAKDESSGTTVNVINSDLIAHNIHPRDTSSSFGAIVLKAENISVNIDKNSSVTATSGDGEVQQKVILLYEEANNNEIRIENGAVLLNDNVFIVADAGTIGSNVIIIPAKYTEAVKSAGFDVEIVEGGEVVKIIDPVPATINGVKYDSVEEAIAAAVDNDTIELANNISIDIPLTLDKSIRIVSNGATINDKITIKEGASVVLEGLNIVNNNTSNTTRIIESDSANITLKGCTLTTNSELHDIAYFKACDNIVIEDCDFSGSTNTDIYNFMEFCLNPEKNINNLTIKDCKFGVCKNNVISLHSFTDDAIVTIEGCEFEYSGNAVRVSNYTAAENVAINLIDNIYHSTIEGEYAGFILFQKQNKEGIDKFNTMNVNISNLIGPNGVPITSNGTGTDQVWYTYITDDEPNVVFLN